MKKVCFVCLGNICRNPIAEFVMKDLTGAEGWLIESCATSGWGHGSPIHHEAQSIFKKHNINYDKHKLSQQVSRKDLYDFDIIIGMGAENVADLKHMSQGRYNDKIFLFVKGSVPDPWFTDDLDATYDLVRCSCKQWLARLKSS